MMLPGFGIVDVHSNAENLLLETFLLVSDMSAPALIGGWRSDGHEILLLQWTRMATTTTATAMVAGRAAAAWRWRAAARLATVVAMVATAGRRLRRERRRKGRRLNARVAMARSTNEMYDIALQRTTAAHRGRLGQRLCIA